MFFIFDFGPLRDNMIIYDIFKLPITWTEGLEPFLAVVVVELLGASAIEYLDELIYFSVICLLMASLHAEGWKYIYVFLPPIRKAFPPRDR